MNRFVLSQRLEIHTGSQENVSAHSFRDCNTTVAQMTRGGGGEGERQEINGGKG